LLRVTELLAPEAKMARASRDLRKEIEKDFGKMGISGDFLASAFYLAGKVQEIRQKYRWDVSQPRTQVTYYNQMTNV
jgi:hypothetical protein